MTQPLSLRLLTGADRGREVPIPRGGLLIGRREGNDLVLEDASVSGRHALVRLEGSSAWVEDLGSTNGTRVDGVKVERAELPAGSALSFGKIELLVVGPDVVDQPRAGSAPASAAQAGAATGDAAPDAGELSLEDTETLLDAPTPFPSASSADSQPAEPRPTGAAAAPAEMPARSLAEEFDEPALDQLEDLRPRDRSTAAAAPARPTPAAAPELDADDAAVAEVDAAILARAKKGGRGALLGLGALVAAAAAAGYYVLSGDDGASDRGGSGARQREQQLVAGNRLAPAVAGFEGDEPAGWDDGEGGPVRFSSGPEFAASGAAGLGLDPAAGQWAEARSEPLGVSPGASLAASVQVRCEGAVAARLALVLSSSDDASVPLTLWSPRVAADPEEDTAEFVRLGLATSVPSGYDRAALRLIGGDPAGRAAALDPEEIPESIGEVAFDDAALVVGSESDLRGLAHGEFELWLPAEAATHLWLGRAKRPLLALHSGQAAPLSSGGTAVSSAGAVAVEPAVAEPDALDPEGRFALQLPPGDAVLDLMPTLLGPETRIAAIVDGQHREVSTRFALEGVGELILGGGLDLVALRFEPPVALRCEPTGDAARCAITGVGQVELRLEFAQARSQATVLANAAGRAESERRWGDVIAIQSELLESVPYDADQVSQAKSKILGLERTALEELEQVEASLERARFFGLAGMYSEVLEGARAIAERYRPTNPEAEASGPSAAAALLAERVSAELAGLGGPQQALEQARSAAVFELLERRGESGLVQRLGDAGGLR